MSHKGSFLGSVAKTVLVGLVASYAIRFIQNRLDAMREDHGNAEEEADTDLEQANAKAG